VSQRPTFELGVGWPRPGESVELPVQASAKHGKHHDIFVPAGRWIRWRNFLLLERPELVTASAKTYFASIPARAPRSVNSLPCKDVR
jgi:hypothetical protein